MATTVDVDAGVKQAAGRVGADATSVDAGGTAGGAAGGGATCGHAGDGGTPDAGAARAPQPTGQRRSGSSSPASEREEPPQRGMMRLVPSYPFPADLHVEFHGQQIGVCKHLCKRHPTGTRGISLFFPGVHGGVGPCRTPGETFDERALFPTVARGLAGDWGADVDCYRCSWLYMRPTMDYAVGAACRVLHHALLEAAKGTPPTAEDHPALRQFRVVFVGHSLGGAVAVQAADLVARHFGADGRGGCDMEGLENAIVHVVGVCTLNGALDVHQIQNGEFFLGALTGSRALLVCGEADDVVPPETTANLFEVFPSQVKRNLVLPGGTHDLFGHRAELVQELTEFVSECVGGGSEGGGE